MSIVEKFVTMEYGPAPEDPREALVWLERHARRFGHFIGGAWQAPAAGQYFETSDPSTGRTLANVAQGTAADVDAAVKAARGALARVAGAHGACAGALSVRAGAAGAEAFAAAGGAGDYRQRQTDSRKPRYRYSAGGAAFLYHAGWAQLLRTGISWLRGLRRRGADHSVEFSAADAGVEDCAGAGYGKHRRAEAGGIYAADGAGVCGNLPGDRACRRAW